MAASGSYGAGLKRWGVRVTCAVICGVLFWPRASMAAQDTPAAWQATGGPPGRVVLLASSGLPDGKFYAVSVSAVFHWNDRAQWHHAGSPSRSYAIYQSQDRGASWQPATNNLPPGSVTALFSDPANGTLYAGAQATGDSVTRRHGLWRSNDDGLNWEQVALERNDLNIWEITRGAGGKYLYLGATDDSKYTTSYVYRSSDNGQSWTAFEALHFGQAPGSTLTDLVADSQDENRLYILTAGGDLYISRDAGATWTLPANTPGDSSAHPNTASQLAISPDDPLVMILARGAGESGGLDIYRTVDGGASWTRLRGVGVPVRGKPSAIAALTDGVFILNTGWGTYRSIDGGVTWHALEGPLSSGEVSALVPVPGAPAGIVAATGYGVFVSRDGGALWQAAASGLPANSKIAGLLTTADAPRQIYAINGDEGLEGTPRPPLLLRSNDDGLTWTPLAQGLPAASLLCWTLDPSNPESLYLGTYEHILHSVDGGLSWRTSRVTTDSYYAAAAIAIAPSNPDVVYAGGRPVHRSSDQGVTWKQIPITRDAQSQQVDEAVGLVVDPGNADHVWAALHNGGVFESYDGGSNWRSIGLEEQAVRWLVASTSGMAGHSPDALTLYAGGAGPGIYRKRVRGPVLDRQWVSVSSGLPSDGVVLVLTPDPRTPGLLWAARDGGGIYRSRDGGTSWENVGAGLGDNMVRTVAIDYSAQDGVLAGTESSGLWALRTKERHATVPPTAVDGRIEVVWPHDWASVADAKLANLGIRLFVPNSLVPPPCGWKPEVIVWQAVDTDPVQPAGIAVQRAVESQPFPYWDLQDLDVRLANTPRGPGLAPHTLYFMVSVQGVNTATSIWAHGSDPRTYFPRQDVPSGIATDSLDALDARIEIVWPHDGAGNERSVSEGTHVNVAVEFFKHGTRLSVPIGWRPKGLALYGAWNQQIGRIVARDAVVHIRQSGAISYPVWEFQNIPAQAATDPNNKLYLWVMVDGVTTYPSIWTHGIDARTYFPAQDEPIQGCTS